MGVCSHSQNIFLYYTPSSYWDDVELIKSYLVTWRKVNGKLWLSVGLLFDLMTKSQKRIIHFRWPWITGPWWCQLLNVRGEDVSIWGLWAGRSRIVQDFIKLLRRAHNLKLNYYLFMDFPFNIFRPCLTKHHGKWNGRWGRIIVMQQIRNLLCFCDI